MNIALLIALAVPFSFALLDIKRDYYPFHLVVTGGCALLLLLSPQRQTFAPLIIGLAFSILGDWFLNHKAQNENFYLFGIGGFFLAHCAFIFYILPHFRMQTTTWIAGALFLAAYGLFLPKVILPGVVGKPMKIGVCSYTIISMLALALAFGLQGNFSGRLLFILGIGFIVFSDTIIGISDFGGNRRFSRWIMPTYYACHLLITASALTTAL